ncbi:hypothetical protein ILYODFUR_006254 [Ilyodon furcidens]|uniref:Uncharacterized protein n=1 Tax=Ilyodon furcidens TaxID=33524 RepID=A0ABV0UGX0_9TELE
MMHKASVYLNQVHRLCELLVMPGRKMKRYLQLEERVLCGLPEVVQHWVIESRSAYLGTEQQSVLFQQQPVG